ncbi:PREDICTED: uncharacterized protein LOC108783203 [Cyphomyrmex costatus]|uniref:uncharacterized protein LOC108783203 n=1 Tax=Cyphomyrmex costatus TaxID=456900 RepID=UPI00085224AA|nr:PREDICTED: uncharacterized protein LOC108783203 [Cyphomyrmex costatus]
MTSAQDISVLKKHRAIVKGACTRIHTYIDAISFATPAIAAQLEERRIKLDEYWSQYNAIQAEIELLDENEGNDRIGFEEAYYSLCAKIRELLNPLSAPRAQPTQPYSPSTSSAFNRSENHCSVRLPKLNLPTFSGKYDEWFPFYDSFNSIIHSNASISDVQKLQYLKSTLTGDASGVISALEISAANYQIAWDILKERYDNRRMIVHTHIKAILDLPSLTKEDSTELRRIADGAIRHVQALKALKCPTAHWDDLLVYILTSKFDPRTLREWQSSLTGTETPTFKQFNDFISQHCLVLETTNKVSLASKDTNKNSQTNAKRQSTCAATVKSKCNYCKGEHPMYYCKEFLALPIKQRAVEVAKFAISNTIRCCTSSAEDHSGTSGTGESSIQNSTTAVTTHSSNIQGKDHIMLSTAVVNVIASDGTSHSCRALLDSGSQASFISRQLAATLGLPLRPLNVTISGVNSTSSNATMATKVTLQSRLNSYCRTIDCIVTKRITEKLPLTTSRRGDYNIPRNLKLADPHFNVSSKVDILIGAEIFWELLCIGQIEATHSHPTLQKTRLGWILAGRRSITAAPAENVRAFTTVISNAQLHDQLTRFWQIEHLDNQVVNNKDDAYCEEHFEANVDQNEQGRYIVKLPIKEELIGNLGSTRDIALRRLQGTERRFIRDPNLRDQYVRFMDEYLKLGHMKEVSVSPLEDTASFYLPHHGVFKGAKQSSKIRVVFDASSKSDTGLSLNDVLRVGPVVQQDLMSIVMRFRTFVHALIADIIKMYRQVLIHPSQTSLQRILWRSDSKADIKTYELMTVTYGTSSASFLTTRCIKHLADHHSSTFPIGSACIRRDFYVDDLLTGADTVQEAETLRDETIELLRLGAFELGKWASNTPELLDATLNKNDKPVVIDDDESAHILGIKWNANTDTLHFSYDPVMSHDAISKPKILSDVSKLYDPLGLLGPIIVIAKLILQDLWRAGIDWDESVPQNLHARWITFKSQLTELNRLAIPRHVKYSIKRRHIQIHGFCDASQNAYGACVYIRTELDANKYRSELLCSKSRIAPLKAVSLPRLELSAALLLARLMDKVRLSIDTSDIKVYLWSDSTITLSWISSESRMFSVFVANRIGEIQRLTQATDWRHVPSGQNPADLLSRGSNPSDLIHATTWWKGPDFLQHNENFWPTNQFLRQEDTSELRKIYVNIAVVDTSVIEDILNSHSNLDRACRVVAYCLRFLRRPAGITTHFVSHEETTAALQLMCKVVQQHSFPEEYKALSSNKSLSTSSGILTLNPFLDDGLIKVGGRLRHSNLTQDARHPVLLPKNHELSRRIITQAHVKPVHSETIMSSLPPSRITVCRPFSYYGVDYAGPLTLREGKRRNAHTHKAYIAMFVCFATKAVHIELVSDLTTDTFLAAFKRIYIAQRKAFPHVQITWNFIPPNAPHCGGLWEATIKSAKFHLYRIISNAHLTFEEMQTILCDVEAILNSRPIAPLSEDPNDLAYLSPGHFLIGTTVDSFPCHDLSDISENRLVRWQRVEQLRQHFWRRWSSEYLHTLQARSKWKISKGDQLKIGQVVLIKQQGLHPLHWLLGRVQGVHPGTDGVVRTAEIKTAKGILTRPLTRIAILPIDDSSEKR